MDGHFGVMIVSNTVDIVKYWIILCRLNTGESWFFEPLRELKIGSKNQIVGEIGDEIAVFQWWAEGEATFGSSYQEVKKMRVREIGILLYVWVFLLKKGNNL